MLVVTDATILSMVVDGVILVIESESTVRGAVVRARRLLESAKAACPSPREVDEKHRSADPRTQRRLGRFGTDFRSRPESGRDSVGIRMVGPLGYLQFLHLERAASLVMTDSGGVQEETTALGVPCITLRENTERPITVTEGTNTVVGFDPERIYTEACRALMRPRKPMSVPRLWDGCASRRIVETLCGYDAPWAHPLPERPGKPIPFQVPALVASC
jgi:hypothetical protein